LVSVKSGRSGDHSLPSTRRPMGEVRSSDLRVRSDGRLRLELRGAKVTCDAGVLACCALRLVISWLVVECC